MTMDLDQLIEYGTCPICDEPCNKSLVTVEYGRYEKLLYCEKHGPFTLILLESGGFRYKKGWE